MMPQRILGVLVLGLLAGCSAPEAADAPTRDGVWSFYQDGAQGGTVDVGEVDGFAATTTWTIVPQGPGIVHGSYFGDLPPGTLEVRVGTGGAHRTVLGVVSAEGASEHDCEPRSGEWRTVESAAGPIDVRGEPAACTFRLPPQTRPAADVDRQLALKVFPASAASAGPEPWELTLGARVSGT